ncbi:MAG: hypothetical protein Q9184_003507 [Pyrenodesmia sp. 2 TL-2023]
MSSISRCLDVSTSRCLYQSPSRTQWSLPPLTLAHPLFFGPSVSRFVQLATSYIIYTMADRRAELLTVQISMAAVAVFAVALRLITRFFILKCPGWDDYIIILGMCLGLTQTILTLSCLPYGAARHMIDITSRADLLGFLGSRFLSDPAKDEQLVPKIPLSIRARERYGGGIASSTRPPTSRDMRGSTIPVPHSPDGSLVEAKPYSVKGESLRPLSSLKGLQPPDLESSAYEKPILHFPSQQGYSCSASPCHP